MMMAAFFHNQEFMMRLYGSIISHLSGPFFTSSTSISQLRRRRLGFRHSERKRKVIIIFPWFSRELTYNNRYDDEGRKNTQRQLLIGYLSKELRRFAVDGGAKILTLKKRFTQLKINWNFGRIYSLLSDEYRRTSQETTSEPLQKNVFIWQWRRNKILNEKLK